MKELLKDFVNAKVIIWTMDKIYFGIFDGVEVCSYDKKISTLDGILELRAFDGVKELYYWKEGSRVYEFKGDEINSTTKMLGKVIKCENGWSKVDDGRGGKFYLPLDKKDGEIIIEKCDIIGYHKKTHQAYIKGYAIKDYAIKEIR
ncbi:hypothetical protein AVCANL279_04715 [Campylobacter canadensis]|uniref:type III-D CRISPR-associated protein Csx19 n=1 Tax=Campylobacter canadensis TaxID=449520 RepID=UPI00155261A7|nr:CRISPR-associated protein Csx19 [Campylobacter canadensis]MBZ7995536.1 hypothetical protein [Campylobacter canadensis]MBZ7996629.1 hypothetical protein [Campylobacter canadensis]MBZ8000236.1 hypothetical protein [Campylobacter canadensis]MBZ8002701.1 hypothetical protein [Campylobacter canadensis]MBZ8003437.1 hypothetical protein [Campylobacter canadensis]